MIMFKQVYLVLILIVSTLIVFGCSNDEIIGTGVTSLSLPSSINLLNADIDVQTNSVLAGASLAAASPPVKNVALNSLLMDPDTDFSTDTAMVFFKDSATDESNSVNFTLCLMAKLKYAENLNTGPYKVVANINDCIKMYEPNWSQFDEATYAIEATVNSTRADIHSPHIIAAWFTYIYVIKQGDSSLNLRFQQLKDISIFNNVSIEYPYGNFTMNSADIGDENKDGATVAIESRVEKSTVRSFLGSNKTPVFKSVYYSLQDSENIVNVFASSIYWLRENQDAGAMQTQYTDSDFSVPDFPSNVTTTNLHRFNENNILTSRFKNPSELIANQSCLSRHEFDDEYLGYNLYHYIDGQFRGNTVGAGDRVKLTSNFYFTYLGQYGKIDAGSYWLENNAVLPDAATITGRDDNKPYTAHVANGSLNETRNIPIALSTLQKRQLSYSGVHPTSGNFSEWILNVDANNDFVITQEVIYNKNVKTLSDTYDHDNDVTTPEISVVATLLLTNGSSTSFHDDSLVQYLYVHDVNVATTDRSATYSTNRTINVGNTDLFSDNVTSIKLYCYYHCAKGGLTQSDVESAAGMTDLYHTYYTFNTTPQVYSLKTDGFKIQLVDDSNNLPVDVSNLNLTKLGSIPIIGSLKLTATPLPVGATVATLDQHPVTYSWVTTADSRLGGLTTVSNLVNELVTSDEPIEFRYTYDAIDDIGNKDPNTNLRHGQQYNLTYINGYLSGLPRNFDRSSSQPSINLADGTVLSGAEGKFVTRTMSITRLLQEKPVSDCANITLDDLLEDNNLTLMTVDDIIEVPFTNADKPEVNSPTIISP